MSFLGAAHGGSSGSGGSKESLGAPGKSGSDEGSLRGRPPGGYGQGGPSGEGSLSFQQLGSDLQKAGGGASTDSVGRGGMMGVPDDWQPPTAPPAKAPLPTKTKGAPQKRPPATVGGDSRERGSLRSSVDIGFSRGTSTLSLPSVSLEAMGGPSWGPPGAPGALKATKPGPKGVPAPDRSSLKSAGLINVAIPLPKSPAVQLAEMPATEAAAEEAAVATATAAAAAASAAAAAKADSLIPDTSLLPPPGEPGVAPEEAPAGAPEERSPGSPGPPAAAEAKAEEQQLPRWVLQPRPSQPRIVTYNTMTVR